MIRFEGVEATNFMRYGALAFQFRPGITAITGANGTGKSAIFEALYWCLTGKTAREGAGVRRRQAKTQEKTEVTLYGSNSSDFTIRRTQSNSGSASFYNFDGEERTAGNLAINQQEIDKFLGLNARFFLSTVLFGHNSFRFTRAKDSDRKAVLEEALALDRFIVAQERAKSAYTANDHAILAHAGTRQSLADTIAELEVRVAGSRTLEVARLNDELAKIERRWKERYKEISEIVSLVEGKKRSVVERELEAARKSEIEYRAALERWKNGESVIANGGRCPACGQIITKDHQHAELIKLRDNSHRAKELVKHTTSRIKECETLIGYFDALDCVNEEIGKLEQERDEKRKALKSPAKGSASSELRTLMNTKKNELTSITARIQKLEKQRSAFEFWVKGFGRQGLISLKIDEAMDELNYYVELAASNLFDSDVVPVFDSTTLLKSKSGTSDKISLTCHIGADKSPYENLSNGQRQKCDIVTMFAWQQMLATRTTDVGIAVFDEVFEGLDRESVDRVMEYVRTYADVSGKCVLLMSHDPRVNARADYKVEVVQTGEISKVVKR